MTDATETLFVYGTLQFPAIAAAVTGHALAGVAAVLDGYARFGIEDVPFPGIVPAPGQFVEGTVYPRVHASARRRIDAFEGDLYRREAVLVRRADDDVPIEAWTYVVQPRWRNAILGTGWDPDAFAREWHDTYVRRVEAARRAGEFG